MPNIGILRRNKSSSSFSKHYSSRPLADTACWTSFEQQLNSHLQEIRHNVRKLHICVQSDFRALKCETLLMCLCSALWGRNVKDRQLRFMGSRSARSISQCTHSNVLPRWVHFASHIQTYRPGLTLCQTLSLLETFLKEANYKYILFLPSGHHKSHFSQIFFPIKWDSSFTFATSAFADKLSICEQAPFVKVGTLERWMFQSMWQAHVRFIEVFGSS